MTRVGIAGHMNLTPATADLVRDSLNAILGELVNGEQEIVGVSCIAAGSDSIFAQAILDLGGMLEVVLPSTDYRESKVKPQGLELFDHLTRAASRTIVMPFARASREAYEAANEALLESCETLIAVWDGQAPADTGGTAAVVASARQRGMPVMIVWPEGSARE